MATVRFQIGMFNSQIGGHAINFSGGTSRETQSKLFKTIEETSSLIVPLIEKWTQAPIRVTGLPKNMTVQNISAVAQAATQLFKAQNCYLEAGAAKVEARTILHLDLSELTDNLASEEANLAPGETEDLEKRYEVAKAAASKAAENFKAVCAKTGLKFSVIEERKTAFDLFKGIAAIENLSSELKNLSDRSKLEGLDNKEARDAAIQKFKTACAGMGLDLSGIVKRVEEDIA